MKNLLLIMLFSTCALRCASPVSLEKTRAAIVTHLQKVKKESTAIGIKAALIPLLSAYTPPEVTEADKVYIKTLVHTMRTTEPLVYAGLVLPHTWADACGMPKIKFVLVQRKPCLPAPAQQLPVTDEPPRLISSPMKALEKLRVNALCPAETDDVEQVLRLLQVISTSPVNFEEVD